MGLKLGMPSQVVRVFKYNGMQFGYIEEIGPVEAGGIGGEDLEIFMEFVCVG